VSVRLVQIIKLCTRFKLSHRDVFSFCIGLMHSHIIPSLLPYVVQVRVCDTEPSKIGYMEYT